MACSRHRQQCSGRGPCAYPPAARYGQASRCSPGRPPSIPRRRRSTSAALRPNQSFDAIERAISEAVPELKTPLIPKNVPWFTVRPDDFPNSEIAAEILTAYGEDRGDGTRRLYRFPVGFPADMWQAVMPHELIAWG